MSFYVGIDGVSEKDLNSLGYYKLKENDEFEIWSDPRDEDHIVRKNGTRHFYVEDVNEAIVIRARSVIPGPP